MAMWSKIAKYIREASPCVATVTNTEYLGRVLMALPPGALVTATIDVGESPTTKEKRK